MISGSTRRFFLLLAWLLLCLGICTMPVPELHARQTGDLLSSFIPSETDSSEIASLLADAADRNLGNPDLSDDGFEIDFVLEYGPLGRRYLTVYIVDDEAFLPLFDLFSLFRINIEYSSSQRIVSGFYIDEEIDYAIDFVTQTIRVGERSTTFTSNDIRIGNNGFYLKPTLFEEMFDLIFDVDPTRLRITLETEVVLPVVSLQERERERSEIEEIPGAREFYPLEFPRSRTVFGGGFLDYQLSGSAFNSLNTNTQQISASYGFELLGGDMSGQLNLNRSSTGDLRTSTDLSTWRFVISDNPYMTTIRAGNVATQGLSGGRVRGVSFTNEPLYLPEIFDVYPIFGVTEPQAQVELLLNNRLVDFMTVDESGEYELFVPIRYGNTTIEVVKYLPDGRVRRELIDLRIPGSFLSPGEIRYSGTVGLAENGRRSFATDELQRDDLAGSVAVSAGLTRRLTATQTLYYRENEFDPRPETSTSLTARVGRGFLVSTTAAPGSRYDLQLSTLSVSRFTFSGAYTFFEPGNLQNSGVRQQASSGLSLPIRIIPQRPILISFSGTYSDLRSGGNRLSYRASSGFSLSALRFRVTYRDHLSSRQAIAPREGARATYTLNTNTGNLPFISRLTGRLSLTANLDHDVENRQLTNFSMRAYKSFSSRASFNATFDRDLIRGFNSFQAGLQIRFNKVRSTTNTRISDNSRSVTQTLSGSVGYDDNFHRFVLSERNMVGSSGVSVVQFMDADADGRYDDGEEILAFDGLGFVSGGQKQLGSDGVLRLWQLPAYRRINFSVDNLRNPNPTAVTFLDQFSIFTDPNRFKLLEVPYDFSGVAIGGVYQMNRGQKDGLGGARIIIRAKDGSFEIEERTFSDGGFYVMDIPPGDYILELSPLLVSFMDVGDQVTQTEFTITPQDGGDFVDGIEIVLQGEPLLVPVEPEPLPEPEPESMVEDRFVYQVQAGSFMTPVHAERLEAHLNSEIENRFNIYYSEFTQQFAVRTDMLHTKQIALDIRNQTRKMLDEPDIFSLPDPFLVYLNRGYYNGRQKNQTLFMLQAGLFNQRQNADQLAEKIGGQSVRLPSESQYRVFKGAFNRLEEALDAQNEMRQQLPGGHSDYYVYRVDGDAAGWPVPVEYRIEYGVVTSNSEAVRRAADVGGVVEKIDEGRYRIVSEREKPFRELYQELMDARNRPDFGNAKLFVANKNSMEQIHRIVYRITALNSEKAGEAFDRLCGLIEREGCGQLIQRNRVEDALMITPNTVNAPLILELNQKRGLLEEFLNIERYMEQIPVLEVLREIGE